MKLLTEKNASRTIMALAVLLTVALFGYSIVLWKEMTGFIGAYSGVDTGLYNLLLQRSHALRQPVPLRTRIEAVRPWMTFDYINKLFSLPPDYLKTNLPVKNTKYPSLSIYNLAKSEKQKTEDVLNSVKKALTDYFQEQPK